LTLGANTSTIRSGLRLLRNLGLILLSMLIESDPYMNFYPGTTLMSGLPLNSLEGNTRIFGKEKRLQIAVTGNATVVGCKGGKRVASINIIC